jgi:hypothetical protein
MVILGGGMMGTIAGRTGKVGWRDWLRSFAIPSGVEHGAVIGPLGCAFLAAEFWKPGVSVTGADVDFVEA